MSPTFALEPSTGRLRPSLGVRSAQTAALAAVALVLAVSSAGCAARGLGDPCVPESIPAEGFVENEIYVETSAVQCRTRACIVFRLAGNPERIVGSRECMEAGNVGCVSAEEAELRVHCTCRCSAGGGESNLPLCGCTEGFHCVDVLTAGGAGIRGGYCVRDPADPGYCGNGASCPDGRSCVDNYCR